MKKLVTLILVLAMMIGFAVVANAIETYGTVVYGYKVDKAPNMEMIDESWGEPVAYVDKNSPNAELAKYWTHYNDTAEGEHAGTGPNGRTSVEPEDSDFWLYICYDSKYIYFGFKSPDEFPYGCVELHRGDGIHMWLQPLETMEDPAHGACGRGPNATEEERKILQSTYYFYWNLAYNDYDTDKGNAADFVNEAYVWFYDDMMHATIAIPRSYYGLHNKNLDGVTFGISVLRCSSWCELDEGFAGWLNWGEFMSSYTTKPDGVNTVVFVDAKQGEYVPPVETEAPETEAPAVETEAPETTAPETEAPETEAPETEAPETEVPETEAPAVETDAPEVPETDSPAVYETETPEVETESPAVETDEAVEEDDVDVYESLEEELEDIMNEYESATETEAPVVETEAPETEAPVVETEAPETEAPVVETEAPETSAPTTPAEPAAEKNNTGLIIGIVAAVVVVGAVVGIVLGKKKK